MRPVVFDGMKKTTLIVITIPDIINASIKKMKTGCMVFTSQ